LAERIDGIDRLMPGDLAWRHDNEAVFRVQDAAGEQPRCDAFEISPSGPIFGYRMTSPAGDPGQIEQQILSREGITPATFRAAGLHKVKGARRPLRFRPTDCCVQVGTDQRGDFVELRFVLPAGCYATAVVREICKSDVS
jgi:tRNA pseudouridine13 synthase